MTGPMIEAYVSAEEFRKLDPAGVVDKFKRLGFRFLSETPPIKFAQPFKIERDEKGNGRFRQWDPSHAAMIEFENEKIAALRSLDVDKIVAFRRKWGLECPDVEREFYLAGAHRFRQFCPALTEEERNYSAHWLFRNGYSVNRDEVYTNPPEVLS